MCFSPLWWKGHIFLVLLLEGLVGLQRIHSAEELMLLNYGVGEDFWESLGQQGDPTIHPKGNQSFIFIGRTDAEAETPVLCLPDAKNWLIWKDPDAGKDWRWEKGMTEDAMVEWHHRLDGHSLSMLGSRWWTGRPGMLKSMGLQSLTWLSDWADELIWSSMFVKFCYKFQNF